ncbi:MAG: UvrB/UvrC motif-containing protein [Gemmatimonadaceae bacterium]|nr:UvrB/UvrC motif-containing protein [Gemmatimonadaceae bacterium]
MTGPAAVQRDLFALFGVAPSPRGRSDERLSVERAVTLAEMEAAKLAAGSALAAADMSVGVDALLDDTTDGPATARKRRGKRKPVADLEALRELVRAGTQDRPGTYRFLGTEGSVLYVGKSKQLRTRLLSYFRAAWPDDKGARILWRAARIEWEYQPSEFAALLRELRLIKQLRPRYNWMMKRDARHYCFVKLTAGVAPKLTVTRDASGDERGTYFGPYLSAGRVNDALRELSDLLGLRDCANDVRMHLRDQEELPVLATPRTPGCIRHEIGKCLGPCVGAVTERDYAAQLAMARAFLDGTSDGPLDDLQARMQMHSDALEFERAAQVRDKLQRLELLRIQLERLRFAVETLTFAYPVTGHGNETRIYLIKRGTVRADLKLPTTRREQLEFTEWSRRVFLSTERPSRQVPTHEIDELLLLSSWFQRHPAEHARTLAPELAVREFGA